MSGKSESEKERKQKRSACWHFFDKTPGGGFCKICQKEIFTQAGGTTNLRNHLRRKHGELWTAIMENRLDPTTLSVMERPSVNHGDGVAPSEEEPTEAVSETSTAVHTIQAYRDASGNTFLYLQPSATDGEQVPTQLHAAQFQPLVANSESISANGEIVMAVQKDPSTLENQAVDNEPKAHEESSPPRKIIHVPVKNYQGSSISSRAVVRQLERPNPVRTAAGAASSSNNNTNSNDSNHKSDSFDAFGTYIASLLRNLPTKTAWKLQAEIVNWILKEQIKNNS